jgi:hypothetical protein
MKNRRQAYELTWILRANQLLSALFLVWLTATASAASENAIRNNVLFFDLNNAEAEVAQFESELPSENRQLFLVPSLSRFDLVRRKKILALHRSAEELTARASSCAPLTRANRTSCHAMWDELRDIEVQRELLTLKFDGRDALADTRLIGDNVIDIVVISGHHQRKFFRGELAELHVDDLFAIAKAVPHAFNRARTVILLGCDTGTPDMLARVFKKLFPAAELIVGSELPAPTRDEPRNLSFIRELLRHEARLHAATTPEDVAPIYQRLLAEQWPVTLLWKREHFFSDDWRYWESAPNGLRVIPRIITPPVARKKKPV